MIGLPFLFTTFIISFPAGLIVYWITTNLWTVGQQYIIRRRLGPMTPPKLATAGAPAAVSDKEARKAAKAGLADPAPPKPKPSGPPPSARKKKKRSGRRR
jgi:YidC/Oxa1 family membrane protein insertase